MRASRCCLLLALLAGLVLAGPQRLPVARLKRASAGEEDATPGTTLREALEAERAAAPAPEPAAAPVAAPEVAAPPRVEVPAGIFRAYDIRGIAGRELTVPVARLVGQAIGSELIERGMREIVIARDGRLSGEELSAAVAAGLCEAGCQVLDIGQAPSPVAYLAA